MAIWPASSPSSVHEAAAGERDQISSDELSAVLSHYPLGQIQSTQEFRRGSRRSPKVLIITSTGKFLLKRRAPGKDDPQRVGFSHAIQMRLAARHFPLARLVATGHHHSYVKYRDHTYELFAFIVAERYAQTLEATEDAGRILAVYHQLLSDFSSAWHPSTSSYHRAPTVDQSFSRIESAGNISPALLRELRKSYAASADLAEQAGFQNWPARIVHADWHPGNLLFKDDRVVAVLDFDSARRLPLAIDLANGSLQFSMIDSGENAADWPAEMDQIRYRKFLRGYRKAGTISPAEIRALPFLMIEALIAEAVFPIAVTGMFGRISGESFLHMVTRKANWLANHAKELEPMRESA